MMDIETALTDEVLNEAEVYARRQLQPCLDAAAAAHHPSSEVCEPELSSDVLEHCISKGTEVIRAEYRGYSGLRWLWLLRRLPESFFEGDYLTTQGADATLAEVLGGQSTGRSRMLKQGNIRAYPVDEHVVRRLARFCASVRWLAERQRDYRCTGKGFSFEFAKGALPRRVATEEQRRSVDLYDRRVEAGGGLGAMGTEVFGPNTSSVALRGLEQALTGDPFKMLIRVLPIRPITMQVPAPGTDLLAVRDEDMQLVTVRARHMVIPMPLANLCALVGAAPPSGFPVVSALDAALLLLLFASTLHVVQHGAGFVGLFTMGYLLSDEAAYRARISEAFALAPQSPLQAILEHAGVFSADHALELIDGMNGSTWPLEAGPVILRDEDALAVDLVAAGRRVADIVFPRVQGALANARGEHFELRVQAAVDATRFTPPAEIGKLRGKKLKLKGLDITDLDAVAQTGPNQLLLISCKSVIYSPEYEMGRYREVRNAATTARNAQTAWDAVLAKLRANPVGDTYDFSGWDLVGVVCTSSIVWIELGPCTQDILKGLLAVVSLSELQEWLSAPQGS